MTPSSKPPIRLLFVTGVFRSGTSLLYACLNNHPAIALMYEAELQSHDIADDTFTKGRWLENANAWGKFLGRHDLPPYPSDASQEISDPLDVYQLYAIKHNATYGGEKSPILAEFLPELAERFPTSKIITISRHPAAVLSSITRAASGSDWFRSSGTFDRALADQESLLQASTLLHNQGRRLLHLTYENLTSDPARECHRICDYLEIPFHEAMLHPDQANLEAVYEGDHHFKLRSSAIQASTSSNIQADLQSALDNHWQRTLTILDSLGGEAGPAKAPPTIQSPTISEAISRGQSIQRRERLKRRIFHRLPAPVIRVFRAVKLQLGKSRQVDPEQPHKHTNLPPTLVLPLLLLVCLAAGASLQIGTNGNASPIIFYLIPVLFTGWLRSKKLLVIAACLVALAWTLLPRLSFDPNIRDLTMVWNFISRVGLLLCAAAIAWSLKVSLLSHQQNPHRD